MSEPEANLSEDDFLQILELYGSLSQEDQTNPDFQKMLADANKQYIPILFERAFTGKAEDRHILALCNWFWPDLVLDDWQPELIRHILSGSKSNMRNVFIKGCTGSGKTFALAVAANLWFEGHEKCKIRLVGPSAKHSKEVMFDRIKNLRMQMQWIEERFVFATEIKDGKERSLIILNPNGAAGMSGHHSDATLFIFDESSDIPEDFWTQASSQSQVKVAAANPRYIVGWFFESFPKATANETQVVEEGVNKSYFKTISAYECKNVIEGENIIPGQITNQDVQDLCDRSDYARIVFVEGHFPEADSLSNVFQPEWVFAATAAHEETHVSSDCFGLDVSRSNDGDQTVAAAGNHRGCDSLYAAQMGDLTKIADWFIQETQTRFGIHLREGGNLVAVDESGVGGGLVDILKREGVRILPVDFGRRSNKADRYVLMRTEIWGELAARLDLRGVFEGETWCIPEDKMLIEELMAAEKIFQGGAKEERWALTPKKKKKGQKIVSFMEKLGRSPDRGDAIALLYHAVQRSHVAVQRQQAKASPLLMTETLSNVPLTQNEVGQLPEFLQDILNATEGAMNEPFPEPEQGNSTYLDFSGWGQTGH